MNTMKKKYLENTVCIGVLNPKGEPDGKQTTYFTQSELKRAEQIFNDKNRAPIKVYINHVLKNKDGKEVEPSGEIINAKIRDDNGKLYVAAMLYDNENGKLASKLVNDKNIPMRNFSMGYKVFFKNDAKGNLNVINKEVSEVSLCYRGAREDTLIGSVTTLDNIIKEGNTNILNNKSNINKNINLKDYTKNKNFIDNIKTVPDLYKNMNKSEVVRNELEGKRHSFVMGCNNAGINSQMSHSDFLNNLISHIPKENDNIKVVEANAAYDGSTSMPAPTSTQSNISNYNASTPESTSTQSNTNNVQSGENKDFDINAFIMKLSGKNQSSLDDNQILDVINKLKNGSNNNTSKSNINIPMPQTTLADKLTAEYQKYLTEREPIPDNIPDSLKQQLTRLYADEESRIKEGHRILIKKDEELRTNIQTNLKNILPNLVRASEKTSNPFTEDDIKSFSEFMGRAPELGPMVAQGTGSYINAQAAYLKEMDENGKMAADTLQRVFETYQDTKSAVKTQHSQMQQLQNEIEMLKKQNEMLKNNVPVGTNPLKTRSDNNNDGGVIKKVKSDKKDDPRGEFMTYNSNPNTNKNSMGNFKADGLNKYGLAAYTASIISNPELSNTEFPMAQARLYNDLFNQYGHVPCSDADMMSRLQQNAKKKTLYNE